MNKKMLRIFREKNKLEYGAKFYPDDQLIFICEKKFKTQYNDMKNLRKSLDDFIAQMKNMTLTIDNLHTCFGTLYEPNWLGRIEFQQSCQNSINAWRTFIEEFKSKIQKDIDSYAEKFPHIQKSIDKCSKKASDLQKQKTIYETSRSSKKSDSSKIKKAETDFSHAQVQYKEINDSLKKDLPEFCDSRIQLYHHVWSFMFQLEGRLYQTLQEERKNQLLILDQFNEAASSGKYQISNQTNTAENQTNLIYDKKKAVSVMNLFSSERRNIEVNLVKGSSEWNINDPDSIYDQIPYNPISREDASISRTQSYQVGKKNSRENLNKIFTNADAVNSTTYKVNDSYQENPKKVFKNNLINSSNADPMKLSVEDLDDIDSSPNLKDFKVDMKSSVETLNQTLTSDSASSMYSIDRKDPITKKLSFDTRSISPKRTSLTGVIMRPSPSIHMDSNNDAELNNVYAKFSDKKPQVFNRNSSSQSQNSDFKKNLSKKVSISLNSGDFYNTSFDNQPYYHVIAKFNYIRQDDDELDLRKDDIIIVLPWECEDQKTKQVGHRNIKNAEDGWLFGENVETKAKGLFPENHTNRYVN